MNGTLSDFPCRWDFPHIVDAEYALPEVKVGTWGGFGKPGAEAQYARQQAMLAKEEAFIARFKARASHAAQVQSRVKKLDKIDKVEPPRRIIERTFDLEPPQRSGDDVIKLEGVRKAYGDRVVHDGVDLLIRRQERWAVMGENGAGKTTLTRGFLRGYGHEGAVKSPTYTLVEPYELAHCNIYHFDLYRLSDPEEFEYLGTDQYFESPNLCLVEWAEHGAGWAPSADLRIELCETDAGRTARCSALSQRGSEMLSALFG